MNFIGLYQYALHVQGQNSPVQWTMMPEATNSGNPLFPPKVEVVQLSVLSRLEILEDLHVPRWNGIPIQFRFSVLHCGTCRLPVSPHQISFKLKGTTALAHRLRNADGSFYGMFAYSLALTLGISADQHRRQVVVK
jgi:hypothetical protein